MSMNATAKTSIPSELKTLEEIHGYGCKLWAEKDFQGAFECFEKAYEMEPENPAVITSHCLKLLRGRHFKEAERLLRQAIEIKPDLAEAYEKLSYVLFQTARTDEAIKVIKTAIELSPNNADYIHKLGAFLSDTNDLTEALFWQERAVKMNPNNPYAYYNYGLTLNASGLLKEADEAFHKCIALKPNYEAAYYNILSMMEQQHQLDEIATLLEEAEKHIPNTITVNVIKARLAKRDKKYDEAIEALEQSRQNPKTALYPDLMFELGTLYDKTKQYDKAYNSFVTANDARLEQRSAMRHTIDRYNDIIKAIAEPFTHEWVESWSETLPSDDYPTPDFLVGFPRSGTTLIGQILDSHPKLFVAEEVEAVERAQLYLSTTNQYTYPGCMKTLGPASIEKMRAIFYANHRNNSMWEEGKTLVDKHPLNMGRAGTIYRMFPDAKFIFAARHPCDCIFSSFMQNFRMNDAMIQMTSLERIVEFYIVNMDIWNKYRDTIPDLKVHMLRYEDLVNDFGGEVAKTLDFLGLEWNDKVLQYNKNAAANPRTNTPSYSQVIQPIYKSATYRWENYRKYFEPHLDRLKPYIEQLGYEA